jgi:hypothetical protein
MLNDLSGFIEFEAERIAPTALLRQLRRSPPQTPTDEGDPHPRARRASAASASSLKSSTSSLVMKAKIGESTPWKDPQVCGPFASLPLSHRLWPAVRSIPCSRAQGHHVLAFLSSSVVRLGTYLLYSRYLMEIRDRAFHLLLRKTGDATPLLHSMRIGQSHKDVSIVLLGAFSRWVNHLEDNQIHLPQTRTLLKSLRSPSTLLLSSYPDQI